MWKHAAWAGLCAGLFLVMHSGAAAEAAPPINIPACVPAPVIDGVLDDACWQAPPQVACLYPPDGDQADGRNIIRLAYDREWLYLAFDCGNPNMPHVQQRVFQRDGPVFTDDAMEIFIRPDPVSRTYYHFALSFANVQHDKRLISGGARDETWSAPWRSATIRHADGWTAEAAIPWFALDCADLAGMQINVLRNFIDIELDAAQAPKDERRLGCMLRPGMQGGPHDFKNFAATAELGGFKPAAPFVPLLREADATGFMREGGSNYFGLSLQLDTGSPVAGKAAVAVLDLVNGAEVKHDFGAMALDGPQSLTLKVPCADWRPRRVRILLTDPANPANLLAVREIADSAALNVIRDAYVERSYYTAETAAVIQVELALDAETLQGLRLAIERAGARLAGVSALAPRLATAIPLSALEEGDNPLTVRLLAGDRELAARPLTVRRLAPRPGREIKMDYARGIMLKDGQPLFALGIFGHTLQGRLDAGVCDDDDEYVFRHLGETGLNTLIRTHGEKENLDRYMRLAEKYGLNVITWSYPRVAHPLSTFKPPHPDTLPLGERLKIRRALYDQLEPDAVTKIKLLREYKNFIGYYNQDEPNLPVAEDRIAVAEWYWKTVRPLDPYRPLIFGYARQIPAGDNWTRWGDIIGYDVYPNPHVGGDVYNDPGLGTAYYACDLRERCRRDHKIMWFIPVINLIAPQKQPIGMSKAHMLCQAYSAVIYGARGLLYFTLSAAVGADAWDGLQAICRQMQELAPALLNGDIPQSIAYSPDEFRPRERIFPMVNAAVYRYPAGGHLLLAVNIKPFAVETEFKIGGLKDAARLFDEEWQKGKGAEGESEMELGGETFQDRIEPYGVRAYRLELSAPAADSTRPVEVAVKMTPAPEERYPLVDVPAMVARLMLGKNHVANPCFQQQTNQGIPDFYKPYFCLSTDPQAGQKGSTWFVDDEVLWEGHPSLRMFRRKLDEPGPKTRGLFGSFYPPPSSKPVSVTFSFYARGAAPGAQIGFIMPGVKGGDKTFNLDETWQRCQLSFDLPPGKDRRMGVRLFIIAPTSGSTVWINGLQLEQGGQATEFEDSSQPAAAAPAAADPANLLPNGGAEQGAAEGWPDLRKIEQGELGVRRGAGRSGEFAFYWRGQSGAIHSPPVAINTAKTYELSGWFKLAAPAAGSGASTGARTGRLLFGIAASDNDAAGRLAKSWHYFTLEGTRTALAAPCSPDNQILKLRDGSNWQKGPIYAAAFGREENHLNFDATAPGIAGVQSAGDHWQVTLAKPCGMSFPAGTVVVENRGNVSHWVALAQRDLTADSWTEIKLRIEPGQWWRGMEYARVIIVPQRRDDAWNLCFDDLDLRETSGA